MNRNASHEASQRTEQRRRNRTLITEADPFSLRRTLSSFFKNSLNLPKKNAKKTNFNFYNPSLMLATFLCAMLTQVTSSNASDGGPTPRDHMVQKSKQQESEKEVKRKKTTSKGPFEAMQTKYRQAKTLTAEFIQRQHNLALGTTKETSGRISFKRPDKFLWETLAPEKATLVSNGKTVWYYTAPFREGEQGQVMIRKAADVQSRLAIDVLAGHIDTKKDFKIKKISSHHYQLKPLKPAGDIERIELYIEKPTNLVYKLELFTATGNKTELMLKDVTLGVDLKDSIFNFKPPENTEVVQ